MKGKLVLVLYSRVQNWIITPSQLRSIPDQPRESFLSSISIIVVVFYKYTGTGNLIVFLSLSFTEFIHCIHGYVHFSNAPPRHRRSTGIYVSALCALLANRRRVLWGNRTLTIHLTICNAHWQCHHGHLRRCWQLISKL